MAQIIEIKATGESKGAVRALLKINKAQEKTLSGMRRQSRESKRTARSVQTDMGSMGTSLATFAAGFISVNAAIRLMGSELTLVQERWAKAAQTITTTGGGFFETLSALPAQISKLGKPFIDQLLKDAQEVGRISQREILKTITIVGSTIGEGGGQAFRQFTTTAARISGLTTTPDAPLFAGGLVKVAGLAGLGGDAAAALGQIVQLGLTTNIPSVAIQAKNIPRALAKIVSNEPSFVGGARLFSSLALFGLDPTGEQAGTGAGALAEKIRTAKIVPAPPGLGVKRGDLAPLPEELIAGKTTLQIAETLRDILEAEGGTRARREEVIAAIGGESIARSFLRAILTRDPRVESQIRFARQELLPIETEAQRAALRQIGEENLQKAERLPQVQLLRAQRGFDVAVEQLQLGDVEGGVRGVFLRGIKRVLESTPGESALRTSLEGARTLLLDATAQGAVESGIETLRAIQERNRPVRRALPRRIAPGGFGDIGFGGGFEGATGEIISPGNERVRQTMEFLIGAIREYQEFTQQQIDAQKENTAELKKNGKGANGRFRPADGNDFE